ncbi:Biogenesis of lysosome-related organelles complex 1 subunit 7 [Plasmodiophora brassicae]
MEQAAVGEGGQPEIDLRMWMSGHDEDDGDDGFFSTIAQTFGIPNPARDAASMTPPAMPAAKKMRREDPPQPAGDSVPGGVDPVAQRSQDDLVEVCDRSQEIEAVVDHSKDAANKFAQMAEECRRVNDEVEQRLIDAVRRIRGQIASLDQMIVDLLPGLIRHLRRQTHEGIAKGNEKVRMGAALRKVLLDTFRTGQTFQQSLSTTSS